MNSCWFRPRPEVLCYSGPRRPAVRKGGVREGGLCLWFRTLKIDVGTEGRRGREGTHVPEHSRTVAVPGSGELQNYEDDFK